MKTQTTGNHSYEVIIIGGSYAGLSAAMALGRSLRKVLIIDHETPCNKPTPHSHNFLTQDGKAPVVIANLAKEQVLAYNTVDIKTDLAINCTFGDNGFKVETKSGNIFHSKKILLATGIKDILPNIDGFAECWGKSVIHCPYCHGFEYRHKKTGILADGDAAMHHAQLVKNLTDKLSIFSNGRTNLTSEQLDLLIRNDVAVIETPIKKIKHQDGYIEHLIIEDGTMIELDALYARLPFEQHSDIPAKLGCKLDDHGFISVNKLQETSVEGVFAAGDNSSGMRSVANAVSTGNLAGAMINKKLCDESFV